MFREGGKTFLTSKGNQVCGCSVLETTDLRESVENDRVSPGTQDGHRSINGKVYLQFQSVSQAVSKSLLLRDALRVFIYSIFFSGDPRLHGEPGQTQHPEETVFCHLLMIGWELPIPAGMLAQVPGILRGPEGEARSDPTSLGLGMSASEMRGRLTLCRFSKDMRLTLPALAQGCAPTYQSKVPSFVSCDYFSLNLS